MSSRSVMASLYWNVAMLLLIKLHSISSIRFTPTTMACAYLFLAYEVLKFEFLHANEFCNDPAYCVFLFQAANEHKSGKWILSYISFEYLGSYWVFVGGYRPRRTSYLLKDRYLCLCEIMTGCGVRGVYGPIVGGYSGFSIDAGF